jgi:hypothetical protein
LTDAPGCAQAPLAMERSDLSRIVAFTDVLGATLGLAGLTH